MVLLPERYFPLFILYAEQENKSFPITDNGWICIENRINYFSGLWTCKCNTINDNLNCDNCKSEKLGKRFGWVCSCGNKNIYSYCKCTKKINKCARCSTYKFQNEECQKCLINNINNKEQDIQKNYICAICEFDHNAEYDICRECLNPNIKLFEEFKLLKEIN